MRTWLTSLALALLAASVVRADDTMTKIVFRQVSPDVAPGSFGSLPKTLYIMGATRGRIEQAPDTVHNVQQLFIADGKDGWIIDETGKTGRHMIDPSTDHNFYAPIIPQVDATTPAPLHDFGLGHELVFMRDRNVSPKATAEDGAKLMLYECEGAGYTLRFYLSADTAKPVKSEVWKDGKMVLRLIYDEYETLPGNSSLFAPPSGVKITEGDPDR